MPTDTNALAGFPWQDTFPDSVYNSDDLVPRNPRVLQARPMTLLDQGVAVADTTGLNSDPHQARANLRDLSFDNFKRPLW